MIETSVQESWQEGNRRYLVACLEPVKQALKQAAGARSANLASSEMSRSAPLPVESGTTSALDMLCALFHLSAFERDILLLCAGVEMDSEFAALCAAAQEDAQRAYPTFNLALAILPDAYWSALLPVSPLRYWKLIEVGEGRAPAFSPLHLDERILHYLFGLSYLDGRLADLFQPLSASTTLLPSQQAVVSEIVAAWSLALVDEEAGWPIVQLCGPESVVKREMAAAIGTLTNHPVFLARASALPVATSELEEKLHLWRREVVLDGSILVLDCQGVDPADSARENVIQQVIEASKGPLILACRERRAWLGRPLLTFDVQKPTADEQLTIWQAVIGTRADQLGGYLSVLVAHFSLDEATIRGIWSGTQAQFASQNADQPPTTERLEAVIWERCRAQARPKMGDLARRFESAATWEDLVLPDMELSMLREIAMHVRQRRQVYETWGFADKSRRGLGISALFVGGSGTGKTMAAEMLANELRFDLYRVDLSVIVSKYIGETEKNLRRIFDAAEDGGTILLFDEADALFGKRSEVKDSHDRYANIEVSYLLQRIEAYRGLAILTTNMKDALDTAFLRRIRFVVQFPFPNAEQRAGIWRRIFPSAAPVEGLDEEKLAQLNVAGGNIRNIALNAAFIAADAGEPIRMAHVLRATVHEYANLGKTLTSLETKGWEL